MADKKFSLKVTGLGDVLAPNGGVIGESDACTHRKFSEIIRREVARVHSKNLSLCEAWKERTASGGSRLVLSTFVFSCFFFFSVVADLRLLARLFSEPLNPPFSSGAPALFVGRATGLGKGSPSFACDGVAGLRARLLLGLSPPCRKARHWYLEGVALVRLRRCCCAVSAFVARPEPAFRPARSWPLVGGSPLFCSSGTVSWVGLTRAALARGELGDLARSVKKTCCCVRSSSFQTRQCLGGGEAELCVLAIDPSASRGSCSS